MSVDRTLFINGSWRISNLVDLLTSRYGEVKVRPTHSPDYVILEFQADINEHRSLSVHLCSERGGFTGTLLTLGAYGNAHSILTTIAKRLGGFYEKTDCEGKLVAYSYVASGNLDYLLRDAAINGRTDGRDAEQFAKFANEVKASFGK